MTASVTTNFKGKSYSQFRDNLAPYFMVPQICGYLRYILNSMSNLPVAPNHVVSISYTLSLADGEVADFAEADEPLVFIHGIGQTLEAFDARLEGLNVGDGFSFQLPAEEGYGMHTDEWIVELPKSVFGGDDIPADLLQLGAMLPMQDQDGNPMDGEVIEIGDDTVKMDFNHPLAGEALHFTGTILAVREATAEELDHGHVHGEGGHHH
jgi:FKBP-type peptidyl-prolyl cis-trans isomerase SlyD